MKRRGYVKKVPLEQIDDYTWRIPQYTADMLVPGIVFADKTLIGKMETDRTLTQCVNVSHLPGIHKYSITLPDGHEGYGFPIGGVAATDFDEGVLSPGGVGYDINCGVRLITTNLSERDLRPTLAPLMNVIFDNVPCGLGSRRKDFKLTNHTLERLVREGVPWAINEGLGWSDDAKHCEEDGCMEAADPNKVSITAKKRGLTQIGTLGSGNHFLEIQKVDQIFDPEKARILGITHKEQVTVMVHCGSRGFGHQICSDYLRTMERAVKRYNISLPDRELACAPGKSEEAENYYQAMACAVNYAFVNRQTIMHWIRQSFQQVFKRDPETFGLKLVYDVAHNIAKIENHLVNGGSRKVWVHRKGATRAFPPQHPQLPMDYRSVGQPVLIPGSMGTSSWLLTGTEKAMEKSFGSTAHGSGRMMSRNAAKRKFWGEDVKKRLGQKGIYVKAASPVVLAEEADLAYKNVDEVIEVCTKVGLTKKIARFVPLAVVKG